MATFTDSDASSIDIKTSSLPTSVETGILTFTNTDGNVSEASTTDSKLIANLRTIAGIWANNKTVSFEFEVDDTTGKLVRVDIRDVKKPNS